MTMTYPFGDRLDPGPPEEDECEACQDAEGGVCAFHERLGDDERDPHDVRYAVANDEPYYERDE